MGLFSKIFGKNIDKGKSIKDDNVTFKNIGSKKDLLSLIDKIEHVKTKVSNNLLHENISKLINLINEYNGTISLRLQNEDYTFNLIDLKDFDLEIIRGKGWNRDIIIDYRYSDKLNSYTKIIDFNSFFILFNSDHVDNEGPRLLTDKSGNIYRYEYHYEHIKLELIANSITELIGDLISFESEIKQTPNQLIKKLPQVSQFIDIERVHMFYYDEWSIEIYKELLEKCFNNSPIRLYYFKRNDLIEKSDYLEVKLKINIIERKIKIQNSRWFDKKFPKQINQIIKDLKQPYMLSFVHENSWNEMYGIVLTSTNEHEKLKSNRLIV